MNKITADQRKALDKVAAEHVAVLPKNIADALIESGHVVGARVDPAPKSGTAVNLTAKGRGALREPLDNTPADVTPSPTTA